MRLILFVSVLGILISIAVLLMVLIKAKKDENRPPKLRPHDDN